MRLPSSSSLGLLRTPCLLPSLQSIPALVSLVLVWRRLRGAVYWKLILKRCLAMELLYSMCPLLASDPVRLPRRAFHLLLIIMSADILCCQAAL